MADVLGEVLDLCCERLADRPDPTEGVHQSLVALLAHVEVLLCYGRTCRLALGSLIAPLPRRSESAPILS